MCYRRRNQWLRLAIVLFGLRLMWLARIVVYLLVGAVEGWCGWRGYANPRDVTLCYVTMLVLGFWVTRISWVTFFRVPCTVCIKIYQNAIPTL